MTTYNWDRVPPEYNWVAIDKSGQIYAFTMKPRKDISRWDVEDGYYRCLGSIPSCLAEGDSTFWEISLEQRPKLKPRYIALKDNLATNTIVLFDRKTKQHLTIQDVLDYYNRESE